MPQLDWECHIWYSDLNKPVDYYGGSFAIWHAYRLTQEPQVSVEALFETRYIRELFTLTSSKHLMYWALASVMSGTKWDHFWFYDDADAARDTAAGADNAEAPPMIFCCMCNEWHSPTDRRMVIHGQDLPRREDDPSENQCGRPLCRDCFFTWPNGTCPYCRGIHHFTDASSGDPVTHPSRQQPRRQLPPEGIAAAEQAGDCVICSERLANRRQVRHTQCDMVICFSCFTTNNAIRPPDDDLINDIIVARSCPFCRGFTQWVDAQTGREVPQVYGYFVNRDDTSDVGDRIESIISLTRIETVIEWNALCEEHNCPGLKVDYTNARAVDLTS